MLTTPEHPWEKMAQHVNEAHAVMVRRGRVFLTYPASATDANFCLGMLTAAASADLTDPAAFTKSALPVFQSDATAGQSGPGHNSFTSTPDGKTDILVYHARGYRDIKGDPLQVPNGHTRAQLIAWREGGMPDFGKPVADANQGLHGR